MQEVTGSSPVSPTKKRSIIVIIIDLFFIFVHIFDSSFRHFLSRYRNQNNGCRFGSANEDTAYRNHGHYRFFGTCEVRPGLQVRYPYETSSCFDHTIFRHAILPPVSEICSILVWQQQIAPLEKNTQPAITMLIAIVKIKEETTPLLF